MNKLQHSIGNLVKDKKKKTDFLNYKFSTLVVFKNTHPPISMSTKPNALRSDTKKFDFR